MCGRACELENRLGETIDASVGAFLDTNLVPYCKISRRLLCNMGKCFLYNVNFVENIIGWIVLILLMERLDFLLFKKWSLYVGYNINCSEQGPVRIPPCF